MIGLVPHQTPPLFPLQMIMFISALCCHQLWLLPEVTGLEKLLLNLMRWVLSSRHRKLMAIATLLNSFSSDCKTWHLKPTLVRGCTWSLWPLLPPSPKSPGSHMDKIIELLSLSQSMLSSHLILPYCLNLKASVLLYRDQKKKKKKSLTSYRMWKMTKSYLLLSNSRKIIPTLLVEAPHNHSRVRTEIELVRKYNGSCTSLGSRKL